jgi:Xaa-Pro dipeptidase
VQRFARILAALRRKAKGIIFADVNSLGQGGAEPPEEGDLEYVPNTEISGRIRRFQAEIASQEVDGCLIAQMVDLFYFTGTVQNAVLWIPASGPATLAVKMSYERAKIESPLDAVVPMRSYRQLPELIGLDKSPRVVGMELDVIPVSVHAKLAASLGGPETVDVSHLIRRVRAVKSAYEIAQMERAAEIHGQVFSLVPSLLKEGMTEIDLAVRLDAEYGSRGAAGPIRVRTWNQEFYAGVVSAGVSANYPTSFDGPDGMEGTSPASPQMAGSRAIRAGEPVIVDLVCNYHGYLVDKTRIYCIGDPSDEVLEAHRLALDIQEGIAARLKPGEIPEEIYNEALERAAASPWSAGFMGFGENRVSFVGHGVGLELDELPVLAGRFKEPLAEGMTVAVEPKFFLDGVGAVGIEDTFVVEAGRGRKLTEFPPQVQVVG